MTSISYEIRVTGTLPPEALIDFEGLTAVLQPTGSVVRGVIRDHAALAGLLARFEASGVEIRNVHRLHVTDKG
ncbi:MAG: hypothetical protein WAK82_26305 [Streptosporangiaceae bacterium]